VYNVEKRGVAKLEIREVKINLGVRFKINQFENRLESAL
jgi:hypothetical protein